MSREKIKLILKKALLTFLISATICHTYNKIKIANKPPSINEDYTEDTYFATYSKGKIYICTVKNQKEVCNLATDKDLVIVDKRSENDPNMKILKSYSIYDVFTMHEVLNILLAYEEMNPSEWNRTYKSMRNEWIIHNLFYMVDYNRKRTSDADLDNDDEELYREISIPRLIKDKDSHNVQ